MRHVLVVSVIALFVGACGDGSTTTSLAATSSASTSPATTSTTVVTTTTTIITTSDVVCDDTVALAALDDGVAMARLDDTGATWITDPADSAYADAVVEPESFARSFGFRCSYRGFQAVGTDHERIGLAAWTGERIAFVVMARDAPAVAYDESIRFDLLFEQPWGEWVTEDVWAVTISSGDTVIIGARDFFHGPVAKSYLVAFPEPPGAPPEIPAERYAIAALEAAGMVNVGIAEPSDTEVAAIVFTTTLGNPMIATVGPGVAFDPFVGYLSGERSVMVIDGIEVQTTRAGHDQVGVADIAFECGAFGWRLEAAVGTPDEPLDVARSLIATLGCD